MKAIILLSGGLDSCTTAKIAMNLGYELTAISFSYGQKHAIELSSAKKVAQSLEIKKHLIVDINPEIFQNTSLVNNIKVPENRDLNNQEIPNTYVPARNILFLSYALSFAESYEIRHIFIGANAVDYSGYPDCRPKFIEAFNQMANIGTKLGLEQGIQIHAPLLELTKAEIIKQGLKLGIDYSITHSCYSPTSDGKSCSVCDSCLLRLKGFADNNSKDPIEYEHK